MLFGACGICHLRSVPPLLRSAHARILTYGGTVSVQQANVVLQTVVAMFSEYCGKSTKDSSKKFTVEPGLVIYPDDRHRDGKEVHCSLCSPQPPAHRPARNCNFSILALMLPVRQVVTPDMSSREMLCSIDYGV
eukprot:SAG11_NODE_735_length_7452_cov_26.426629_5_plen_134_part_00